METIDIVRKCFKVNPWDLSKIKPALIILQNMGRILGYMDIHNIYEIKSLRTYATRGEALKVLEYFGVTKDDVLLIWEYQRCPIRDVGVHNEVRTFEFEGKKMLEVMSIFWDSEEKKWKKVIENDVVFHFYMIEDDKILYMEENGDIVPKDINDFGHIVGQCTRYFAPVKDIFQTCQSESCNNTCINSAIKTVYGNTFTYRGGYEMSLYSSKDILTWFTYRAKPKKSTGKGIKTSIAADLESKSAYYENEKHEIKNITDAKLETGMRRISTIWIIAKIEGNDDYLRAEGYEAQYVTDLTPLGKHVFINKHKYELVGMSGCAPLKVFDGEIYDPQNYFSELDYYKYLKDICAGTTGGYWRDNPLQIITRISRFPWLEQLYKSGYKNLFNKLVRSATVAADIYKGFGVEVGKTFSFMKSIGLSKGEMEWLNAKSSTWSWGAKAITKLISQDAGHKTYPKEKVWPILDYYHFTYEDRWYKKWHTDICENAGYMGMAEEAPQELKERNNRYRDRIIYLDSITMPNEKKFSDELDEIYRIRAGTEDCYTFNLIPDINCRSREDVARLHNRLLDIQLKHPKTYGSRETRTEKEKECEKTDKKRNWLEFDDPHSDFQIMLPKSPFDLITEGEKLSHCVGSYIDDHSAGRTTVLFLRNKKTPDEPFITIEVKNGKVEQVHGKYNWWLGNFPEAIPTVRDWAADKKLSITDVVLRSTSKDYTGDGELVTI
jgi:hypothetical protein